MPKKFLVLAVVFCLGFHTGNSQEIQANVTVIANRVPSTVNHKIFQTLQSALNSFINTRRWSNTTFKQNEKINCNFVLNISQALDNNEFLATLTVQAARPVYNSSYSSPLLNMIDESVLFRYIEYQSLDFSDTRVQGSEPFAANLTAVVAFYCYTIIGLDFDSFSLRGGDTYFQQAQNIVNNAPEGANIVGWNAFDGNRNRYWLMENLTNTKYTLIHDAFYNYYRQGLDQMYEKDNEGRNAILNALNQMNTVNAEYPNTMILQYFFQAKLNEVSKVFRKGTPEEKSRALDLLSKLDIGNINVYKQDLQ